MSHSPLVCVPVCQNVSQSVSRVRPSLSQCVPVCLKSESQSVRVCPSLSRVFQSVPVCPSVSECLTPTCCTSPSAGLSCPAAERFSPLYKIQETIGRGWSRRGGGKVVAYLPNSEKNAVVCVTFIPSGTLGQTL